MFHTQHRLAMADELKRRKIIITKEVYNAMAKVPRHLFIPEDLHHRAYFDSPQKIKKGQTISAPHMNAMMCEYLEIEAGEKILEIGTGSGYQAALLAELVGSEGQIYTIERHQELATEAKRALFEVGYDNIQVIMGDGTKGLENEAPFDKILVTAAGPKILKKLLLQLNPKNGILCMPVGQRNWNQELYVIQRVEDKYIKQKMGKVMFVPLIGENGFDS